MKTTKYILTVAAIIIFAAFNYAKNTTAPLLTANAAVQQLQPSDSAFVASKVTMDAYRHSSAVSFILLLVALGVIWRKEGQDFFKTLAVASVLVTFFGLAHNASAYYEDRDSVEYVEIGMNESAFMVPEQGDNKTKQAQFMSQDYLTQNKVASKRIQIPHVMLPMPGLLSINKYIPAARLVLVDRSPYTREWTKETNKGTSSKDEGFSFESQEGNNIDTAVVIGATVKEEDAAKFLYNFGSKIAGNSSDPQVKFASVVHGRSLADVMDTNVRGVVQSSLAREFKKRAFYDAVSQASEIMDAVKKDVETYCTNHGITLEYIGYDGGLVFDPKIQASIDKLVYSQAEAKSAIALAPTIAVKKGLADADLVQGLADAARKWNGELKLPTFLVASDGLVKWFTGLVGGNSTSSTPTTNNK